jgi:hypothetical protein
MWQLLTVVLTGIILLYLGHGLKHLWDAGAYWVFPIFYAVCIFIAWRMTPPQYRRVYAWQFSRKWRWLTRRQRRKSRAVVRLPSDG